MSNNIDIDAITKALASEAAKLGHFVTVNTHELKNTVGRGLKAAVWFHEFGASKRSSGLSSTSAVFVFRFRIYGAMLQEPQDAIDPDMLNAASAYIGSLSGAFTLGGLVRCIDLKGQEGQGLRGRSGYITLAQSLQRIIDIDVPLIVNDVWDQVG